MGGKPSQGTSKDRRLKENTRPTPKLKTSTKPSFAKASARAKKLLK